MIKISLIMPIYNGEKTLRRSIDSILKQTYSNYELILVNDGSTDSTYEICNEYCEKDSRIKVINKENEGSGPARNKGLEIANGKYVMFLDCDDWLDNTMIEELVNQIFINKVDLVICSSKNYIGDGTSRVYIEKRDVNNQVYIDKNQLRENYIDLLDKSLILGPSDKMYNLDIIKKYNIKFPKMKRSQDIKFNIEYIKVIDSLSIIDKPLYNYVMGNTKENFSKFPHDYFKIVLQLTNEWIDMKNKWGGDEEKWNNYLGKYILAGIYICIANKLQSKCKIMQIKDDLNYMLNQKVVQDITYKYFPKRLDKKIMNTLVKNKFCNILIMSVKCRLLLENFKK